MLTFEVAKSRLAAKSTKSNPELHIEVKLLNLVLLFNILEYLYFLLEIVNQQEKQGGPALHIQFLDIYCCVGRKGGKNQVSACGRKIESPPLFSQDLG